MENKKNNLWAILGLAPVIVIAVLAINAVRTEPKDNQAEPDNDQAVVASELETCPLPAPSVEIKTSDEPGTQIVLLDGKGIGQITVADGQTESEAHILVKRPCTAWIAASTTGRGGYIFYSGDDQLYKVDFATKTLARVNFDGFMTDLSPDQTQLVSVSTVDGIAGSQPSIEVTNTATGAHTQYVVQAPYNDAGSAKFSPDGSHIAYGAIERDVNGDPIKRAVFLIDLSTGQQTLTAREDLAPRFAPYVSGWSDNTTPTISTTP